MSGPAKVPNSTPTFNPPSLKKSTSGSQSSKDQKSILGFFQKKSAEVPRLATTAQSKVNGSVLPLNGPRKTALPKGAVRGSSQSLTPAPSSDALEDPDEKENRRENLIAADDVTGLPSPTTPAISVVGAGASEGDDVPSSFNSPSRKASILAFLPILKLTVI